MTHTEQSKVQADFCNTKCIETQERRKSPKGWSDERKGWYLTPAVDEQGLARQMETINDDGSKTRRPGEEKKGIKEAVRVGPALARKGSTLRAQCGKEKRTRKSAAVSREASEHRAVWDLAKSACPINTIASHLLNWEQQDSWHPKKARANNGPMWV